MPFTGASKDELFVGNTDKGEAYISEFKRQGISSIRLGEIALDIDGNELSAQYKPIFIHRSDSARHNEIMMKRTFGSHWNRYS